MITYTDIGQVAQMTRCLQATVRKLVLNYKGDDSNFLEQSEELGWNVRDPMTFGILTLEYFSSEDKYLLWIDHKEPYDFAGGEVYLTEDQVDWLTKYFNANLSKWLNP